MPQPYAEVLTALHHAQRIIIVSHRHPDGDTAGSNLALHEYLRQQGKTVFSYCVHEVGPYLQFLPWSDRIGPKPAVWQDPTIDTVIVLDSGDPKHAVVDHYLQAPQRSFKIINIDHHITNSHYGDINVVEPAASSTCEIVFHILNTVHGITKDIATCLLTGVITDTGSFSNLATTASSVSVASQLLAYGANLPLISKHSLHYRPYPTLKLWGRALERLHEDPLTGMVVTVLTLQDLKDCGAAGDAASGISNFLNTLELAADKAILVLTQTEPGIIKASLRTTNPLLDVAKFAKLYGGGGHRKAAGFTLNGTLHHSSHGYSITPTSA